MNRAVATLTAIAALAIAPAAHGAVVTDSFTGTNGTLLENHTGETGATWTWHPNYGADLKIQDNRIWGPEWGLYFASGIPPTAEYDVSADLHVKSNAGAIGVVARSSTSGTDNLYMGRYNAASGSWELVKCSGGSCATIGTPYAQTLTAGTTYALKLEVRNATKKLFVDGIQRVSSTDNTITQVGRVGIRSGPGVTTATTGYHLDNFNVEPAATETNITSGPSGPTNNVNPSFSFSSIPSGGTFECRLDGPGGTTGSWGSCTDPKAYSSLAQGSYTFNVRATVSGVVDTTPATRSFTVDTTAPDTSITSGPSGTITTNSATFGFSSPDGTATFECKLDGPGGTTGSYSACTSTKAYSSLANGSYTFSVRAKDPATNVDSSPATQAFTVNVSGGTQCSDGTDNDGDGQTDLGSDPHCHSAADNNESAPPYTVNFDDSFEAATFPEVEALGAWEPSPLLNGTGAYVNQVTPSGYSAKQGTKVAEAHLGGQAQRAELNCYRVSTPEPCAALDNSNWYYEWYVRVPSGQSLPPVGGGLSDAPASIMQSGPASSCGYRGSMRAYPSSDGDSNKFSLTSHHMKGSGCSPSLVNDVTIGNFSRDTWHHILLHIRWSSSSSVGYIEVEVDGVNSTAAGLGPSYPFATHPGGTVNVPFRIGIYRTPAPTTPRTVTFQYDDVKLGPGT